MSSRVVECSTGAQVLPVLKQADPRQKATAWQVFCCISADHRALHPEYAEIAARMKVEKVQDE